MAYNLPLRVYSYAPSYLQTLIFTNFMNIRFWGKGKCQNTNNKKIGIQRGNSYRKKWAHSKDSDTAIYLYYISIRHK